MIWLLCFSLLFLFLFAFLFDFHLGAVVYMSGALQMPCMYVCMYVCMYQSMERQENAWLYRHQVKMDQRTKG